MFQDGSEVTLTYSVEMLSSVRRHTTLPGKNGIGHTHLTVSAVPNFIVLREVTLRSEIQHLWGSDMSYNMYTHIPTSMAPLFTTAQFHDYLTLSSKFFSVFPHGTCLLSVSG